MNEGRNKNNLSGTTLYLALTIRAAAIFFSLQLLFEAYRQIGLVSLFVWFVSLSLVYGLMGVAPMTGLSVFALSFGFSVYPHWFAYIVVSMAIITLPIDVYLEKSRIKRSPHSSSQ